MDDELHRRLAERIQALQKARDFTQEQLADFAVVGRGYLSAILRCKQSPTVRTLQKLARALGVTVKELFPG